MTLSVFVKNLNRNILQYYARQLVGQLMQQRMCYVIRVAISKRVNFNDYILSSMEKGRLLVYKEYVF